MYIQKLKFLFFLFKFSQDVVDYSKFIGCFFYSELKSFKEKMNFFRNDALLSFYFEFYIIRKKKP